MTLRLSGTLFWNSLDDTITQFKTLKSFQKKLKGLLFDEMMKRWTVYLGIETLPSILDHCSIIPFDDWHFLQTPWSFRLPISFHITFTLFFYLIKIYSFKYMYSLVKFYPAYPACNCELRICQLETFSLKKNVSPNWSRWASQILSSPPIRGVDSPYAQLRLRMLLTGLYFERHNPPLNELHRI